MAERYVELRYVDDEKGLSVMCKEEAMPNGGIAKVGGYADVKKFNVNLGGEVLEAFDGAGSDGVKYVLIAPDGHRYDTCLANETFGAIEDVEAGVPTRAYFLHDTMRVRIEKDLVDGEVAVGDKLKPATGFKLTKDATGTDAILYVLKIEKWNNRDTVIVSAL